MDNKNGKIITYVLILIGVVLIFNLAFISLNYFDFLGNKEERVETYYSANITGATEKYIAKQFAYKMRYESNNISFSISDCNQDKRDRILLAFAMIENKTEAINFYEKENPEIEVSCSEEKLREEGESFIVGEGGPSKYLNLSTYSLILKGRVILYKDSSCKLPIAEIHETLHAFGFDHINNSKSIMNPYIGCNQRIDTVIIEEIRRLYAEEAKAELYFQTVSAAKYSKYLNLNMSVINEGIKEAKNVSVLVYANDKKIESFSLGEMKPGESSNFWAKNILLPSANIARVYLVLVSETKEYEELNNKAILEIKEI